MIHVRVVIQCWRVEKLFLRRELGSSGPMIISICL